MFGADRNMQGCVTMPLGIYCWLCLENFPEKFYSSGICSSVYKRECGRVGSDQGLQLMGSQTCFTHLRNRFSGCSSMVLGIQLGYVDRFCNNVQICRTKSSWGIAVDDSSKSNCVHIVSDDYASRAMKLSHSSPKCGRIRSTESKRRWTPKTMKPHVSKSMCASRSCPKTMSNVFKSRCALGSPCSGSRCAHVSKSRKSRCALGSSSSGSRCAHVNNMYTLGTQSCPKVRSALRARSCPKVRSSQGDAGPQSSVQVRSRSALTARLLAWADGLVLIYLSLKSTQQCQASGST